MTLGMVIIHVVVIYHGRIPAAEHHTPEPQGLTIEIESQMIVPARVIPAGILLASPYGGACCIFRGPGSIYTGSSLRRTHAAFHVKYGQRGSGLLILYSHAFRFFADQPLMIVRSLSLYSTISRY